MRPFLRTAVKLAKVAASPAHFPTLALFIVLLLTAVSYLPTLSSDFVYLDDDSHLLDNAFIRGLDAEHLQLMFTQTVQNVYVPLTFLSFAAEYHFFQYDPLIYHLDNLLLHLGVTALVFCFARQMGLSAAGAFFAALIFGVHPVHVESVSWVTERKDVLYALFYMSALIAYGRYLQQRRLVYYFLSLAAGVLSLLAKPMALSLPLILFACDWFKRRALDKTVFWDKVPYFLYVVPIAWITYSLNARVPGEDLFQAPLIFVWTAVFYIRKFLFPLVLVPMYDLPHPVSWLNPEFLLSALGAIGLLGLLWRFRHNRWLTFAALFYVLSMFFLFRYDNVVDKNIVADRFLYLPCLGMCFLAGHGVERLLAALSKKGRAATNAAFVLLFMLMAALSVKTFLQTRVWDNSITFWSYVVEKNPSNAMAFGNRGVAYMDRGDFDRALADMNRSLELDPQYTQSYINRGTLMGMRNDLDAALADFEIAVRQKPHFAESYSNIGQVHMLRGRPDRAIEFYQKSLEINPFQFGPYFNLAVAQYNLRDFDNALKNMDRALAIDPYSAPAYHQRGKILGAGGNLDLALDDLNRSLMMDPQNSEAYKDRGVIYEHQRQAEAAIADYTRAIALDPEYADAYCSRGNVFVQTKFYTKAFEDYGKALEIDPQHVLANRNQRALFKRVSEQSPPGASVDNRGLVAGDTP